MRRFWPLVFLLACTVLPLWRVIFQGQVIGEFDAIRHLAPWNGPAPDRPYDVLQADSVLQFYPWRDLVFEAWGRGQIPAWNHYEMAGTPLLADSQSAAFYPPHILMGVLHVPTPVGMALLAWGHLFWAALGVYYLARRLGTSRLGASVAGAAFGVSPFMVAWTGLPSVISTVAWIPWILGLILYLFKAETRWNVSIGLVFLALGVAMMLLAGHLQFCAYGLFAAGAMIIWLFASVGFQWKKLLVCSVACVLGILLSAPQLLPVLDYSKFSHRANTATEQGYEAYVAGAIPGYSLQSLALPTALGNPAKPSPSVKDLSSYWPSFTTRGMNFAETALSFGPVVFILLALMRKPQRGSAALVFIGAVGLLLALGTLLNRTLYFLVPGWSASGSPGRAAVLFVLAGCVLAGIACDNVNTLKEKRVYGVAVAMSLVGLILALAPLLFNIRYAAGSPAADQIVAAIKASVSSEFPLFAATLIISLGAICLWRYRPDYRPAVPIATALVSFLAYGWNLIPTSSSALSAVTLDPQARYAFINNSWPLLATGHNIMPPNTSIYSRVHDVAGYDSLLDRDSVNLLRAIDGTDPAAPENGNLMFVKRSVNTQKLSEAGVTRLLSLRQMPGLSQAPEQVGEGVLAYLVSGPGITYTPAGPARILEEGPGGMVVSCQGPGPLIVKERLMPGWTAVLDGKGVDIKPLDSPLGKALWMRVDIGPGAHEVRLTYSPPGLKTGWLLFAVSALLCCCVLVWGASHKNAQLVSDAVQE